MKENRRVFLIVVEQFLIFLIAWVIATFGEHVYVLINSNHAVISITSVNDVFLWRLKIFLSFYLSLSLRQILHSLKIVESKFILAVIMYLVFSVASLVEETLSSRFVAKILEENQESADIRQTLFYTQSNFYLWGALGVVLLLIFLFFKKSLSNKR